MTRRRGGSGRGGGGRGGSGGVQHVYEGPVVLAELLRRAGSPHGAEEVAAVFRRAHEAGQPRSAVIPGLFPSEPRFDSPDGARRLYANLFGLWDRIAAGLGAHDDAPEVVPEPPPPPPIPERGSADGYELDPELVEAMWRRIAGDAPRAVQRLRDRFANAQPDLLAWLEASPLPDSGGLAAMDLAFEAWAMFDQAFGDRLAPIDYRDLREVESEPPPIEETQPALAAYVAEQLDNLGDEDPAFGPEERAQVERVLAAAAASLTDAVRQPS
ncbi:MAG TPA: hypothetical protein VFL83_13995 [Anaeromyxobacter sp.]|nr:hypothetical protein [Anaeromyxobacter sp.]